MERVKAEHKLFEYYTFVTKIDQKFNFNTIFIENNFVKLNKLENRMNYKSFFFQKYPKLKINVWK